MDSLNLSTSPRFAIAVSLALAWGLVGCNGNGGGAASSAGAPQLASDHPSGQTVGTTIVWSVSPLAPGLDYRPRNAGRASFRFTLTALRTRGNSAAMWIRVRVG